MMQVERVLYFHKKKFTQKKKDLHILNIAPGTVTS